MTTPSSASALDEAAMRTRLGHEVFARLRRPGRPAGVARPARIGSVATSAARFAAATSRPVPVRRALAGPEVPPVYRYRDVAVTPPRWWAPTVQFLASQPAASTEAVPTRSPARVRSALHRTARPVSVPDLPDRGLPRAVRRVPNEETWTPGRIADTLTPTVVPVRRMDAVTAAGPMLTSQERAAQLATARGARPVDQPSAPPARPRPQAQPAGPTPAGPGLFRRPSAERAPRRGPSPAAPTAQPRSQPPADPDRPAARPAAPVAAPSAGPPSAPSAVADRPAATNPALAAPRWRPAPSERFARAVLDARPAPVAASPTPAGIVALAPLTSSAAPALSRASLRRAMPPSTRQSPAGPGLRASAPAPSIVPPGTAPLRRAIRRGGPLRPGLDVSRAPAFGRSPVVTRPAADQPVAARSAPATSAGPATRATDPGGPRHRAPEPTARPAVAELATQPAQPPAAAAGHRSVLAGSPLQRSLPHRPPAGEAAAPGLAITATRGLRTAAVEPVELRPATTAVDLRPGLGAPTGAGRAIGSAAATAPPGAPTVAFSGPTRSPRPAAVRRRPQAAHLRRRPRPAARGRADIAMPDLLPVQRSQHTPLAGRGAALASGFAAVQVIAPASGRDPSVAVGGVGTGLGTAPGIGLGTGSTTGSGAAAAGLPAAPPFARTDTGPRAPATAGPLPLPAPPPISIQRTPVQRSAAPAASAASVPAARSATGSSAAAPQVQQMIKLVGQMVQRDLSTAASPSQEGKPMAEDPTAPVHYSPGGSGAQHGATMEDLLANRQWFDELVDRVVRRMERHVVDELERRGRRYGNGAY